MAQSAKSLLKKNLDHSIQIDDEIIQEHPSKTLGDGTGIM